MIEIQPIYFSKLFNMHIDLDKVAAIQMPYDTMFRLNVRNDVAIAIQLRDSSITASVFCHSERQISEATNELGALITAWKQRKYYLEHK
jgi:hypothetical protein